jgi:hypothetical protein
MCYRQPCSHDLTRLSALCSLALGGRCPHRLVPLLFQPTFIQARLSLGLEKLYARFATGEYGPAPL